MSTLIRHKEDNWHGDGGAENGESVIDEGERTDTQTCLKADQDAHGSYAGHWVSGMRTFVIGHIFHSDLLPENEQSNRHHREDYERWDERDRRCELSIAPVDADKWELDPLEDEVRADVRKGVRSEEVEEESDDVDGDVGERHPEHIKPRPFVVGVHEERGNQDGDGRNVEGDRSEVHVVGEHVPVVDFCEHCRRGRNWE